MGIYILEMVRTETSRAVALRLLHKGAHLVLTIATLLAALLLIMLLVGPWLFRTPNPYDPAKWRPSQARLSAPTP